MRHTAGGWAVAACSALGASLAIAACGSSYGSSAGSEAPDASTANALVDAGQDGPGEAAAAVPPQVPGGLAFTDTDPVCSELSGTVVITKAADERGVTSYALYWGTSPTAKLTPQPIATLPATGSDVQYQLVRQSYPPTATHLLAFSVSAAGEMATGVALPVSELGQATFTDLWPGAPALNLTPSAVIDDAAAKLLVVVAQRTSVDAMPVLRRCNLDGSGCTFADISAGMGLSSGYSPSAVIDKAGGKLLVAAMSGANGNKASLFRCNLDGSGCAFVDISAGQPAWSGQQPSAIIDAAGAKLLVVTHNGGPVPNAGVPCLYRCDLDGTGCTFADLSAGQGQGSGYHPTALIDVAASKLLVVTQNSTNANKASLYRCNLDGTACAHTDISAGQGANSGGSPSAVIDEANSKLLVVTQNGANQGKPGLFRCNLDGTGCTHTDISAGQGANSGRSPSTVIDKVRGKLLVVAENGASSSTPVLFECNLDGSTCTNRDLSAGQGPNSGLTPSVVIDPASATLLAVTPNTSLGLFATCLR